MRTSSAKGGAFYDPDRHWLTAVDRSPTSSGPPGRGACR